MVEYLYRGFKISYKIASSEFEKKTYKADGAVTYLLNMPKAFTPTKFHAEYDTHAHAEYEIKKLLESYVNFELKGFYGMNHERTERSSEQSHY